MEEFTKEEIELIKAEAGKAEKLEGLTTAQLELIHSKSLFHLLVPKNVGGAELPLTDFVEFIEYLARIDGSFAWAVNLGAGANMFSGYLDVNTAKKIFSSKKSCVAGSGAIAGTAKKVKDGYIINGKWKYASGSSHASYFSLNAYIEGSESYSSFLLPAKNVNILHTWKVMGLKASSSNDFSLEDTFVPDELMFDLQSSSKVQDSPLYSFPFMALAEINMLVMLTGLSLHFYELCMEIAKVKQVKAKNSGDDQLMPLASHTYFEKIRKEVKKEFDLNRSNCLQQLHAMWELNCQGKSISTEVQHKFRESVLLTSESARKMVDQLYVLLGMSSIYEHSEINRVWRDFKVASQHSLLSPLRF